MVLANLILIADGVVELFSSTEFEVVEASSLLMTNVHVNEPQPPGSVTAKSVKWLVVNSA